MYFSDEQGSFQRLSPEAEEEEVLTSPAPSWETQVRSKYDEMDRRAKMINYYKLIIDTQLFNDDSPIARAVEEEIRNFAVDRYETLVGLKQIQELPSAQSAFTDEEVMILKSVANTARRKLEPSVNSIVASKPIETPKMNQVNTLGSKKPEQKLVVVTTSPSQTASSVPEDKKPLAKRGRPAKIQKLPAGVIPMPMGDHFTSVSAMKADEQTRRFGSNVLTDAIIKANSEE